LAKPGSTHSTFSSNTLGTAVGLEAVRMMEAHNYEEITRCELEGLSYEEIAEVVDVPMGTVMSTLCRAGERFRHTATELVGRQAHPSGSEALSDAERQELKPDAVLV
jgi:hypothetical protein